MTDYVLPEQRVTTDDWHGERYNADVSKDMKRLPRCSAYGGWTCAPC
jgi:hypothetical protein